MTVCRQSDDRARQTLRQRPTMNRGHTPRCNLYPSVDATHSIIRTSTVTAEKHAYHLPVTRRRIVFRSSAAGYAIRSRATRSWCARPLISQQRSVFHDPRPRGPGTFVATDLHPLRNQFGSSRTIAGDFSDKAKKGGPKSALKYSRERGIVSVSQKSYSSMTRLK